MALQHSDGFDSHATGSATLSAGDPGWTGQTGVTIQATAGKFGGKSLRAPAGVTAYAAFTNTGTYPAHAAYFKVGTWGGTGTFPLIKSAAGQNYLTVDELGGLRVYDGANNLRITALASLVAGTYAWIELGFRNGSIVLLKDGTAIGTYTGAYTAPATTLRILNGAASLPDVDCDDFISWDNSGTEFLAYGLSPRRIQLLRPNGVGGASYWTPAGATNWQSVDGADWAGAAGVSSAANGQKDLYAFADLTVPPATINAVVVKTRAQNLGEDPGSLQHVAKGSTGVEANGSTQLVPIPAAAVLRSVMYRDPLNVAWTATEVNAAQFGQVSVI